MENTYKKKIYRLSDEDKQQIMDRLAAFMENRPEVVFAYAHGSFIEDIPCHDIDIGVYVSNISKEAASPHALEFSSMLSNVLKMPADVRVINFAPISFSYHVIQGRLILERDENIHAQVIENIIRKYLDIKPLIHRSIREAFAA